MESLPVELQLLICEFVGADGTFADIVNQHRGRFELLGSHTFLQHSLSRYFHELWLSFLNVFQESSYVCLDSSFLGYPTTASLLSQNHFKAIELLIGLPPKPTETTSTSLPFNKPTDTSTKHPNVSGRLPWIVHGTYRYKPVLCITLHSSVEVRSK